MTTTVTVHGAVTVTSQMHASHGGIERETVEQRGPDVGEKGEATFPVHNTMSLMLEGNGTATVKTTGWQVKIMQGDDVTIVERDDAHDLQLVGVPVYISETIADVQPAAEEAA